MSAAVVRPKHPPLGRLEWSADAEGRWISRWIPLWITLWISRRAPSHTMFCPGLAEPPEDGGDHPFVIPAYLVSRETTAWPARDLIHARVCFLNPPLAVNFRPMMRNRCGNPPTQLAWLVLITGRTEHGEPGPRCPGWRPLPNELNLTAHGAVTIHSVPVDNRVHNICGETCG
jgi:hypothetical protein